MNAASVAGPYLLTISITLCPGSPKVKEHSESSDSPHYETIEKLLVKAEIECILLVHFVPYESIPF